MQLKLTLQVVLQSGQIVGSYNPSATLNIYVNSVKDTLAAGVVANAFSGAGNLEFGSWDGGTNLLQGQIAYGFICAAFLSDAQIRALYQQSRSLYAIHHDILLVDSEGTEMIDSDGSYMDDSV